MNTLVHEFFRTGKKEEPLFHAALFLTESKESWEEIAKKNSQIPRGWVELCNLSVGDRIEFVHGFWQNLLPYQPTFHEFLSEFFNRLDDVGVVLSKSKEESPWSAEMVYSLKDNRSFFRGNPPADETQIDELKSKIFSPLPHDYLAFLSIHNGFGKLSEMGLMPSFRVSDVKEDLMDQLIISEKPLRVGNQVIDPSSLIPFFESYGLGSYQCFLTDWYPGSEMGNVYLSGIDYTISDYVDRKGWADQMAFPTFLDWLAFYLEGNSLD